MFPKIIGILNCTPDSFHLGGRYLDHEKAINHALHLFEQGADLVDIGGESTRPHSTAISEEEEIARVIPVIKGIREQTDRPLSIDTFKPKVAKAALDAGVNMLNDITGFTNPAMRTLAAESGAQIVVMHMKGTPHSYPEPSYPTGVVSEIYTFFEKQIKLLLKEGVRQTQIILDPGIGGGSFGKTPQQNLTILKHLSEFLKLGSPLLIGLSRKSFMQKILNRETSELLPATLALNTLCGLRGVSYLRVHDVAEHRDMIRLIEQL